MKWIIRLAAVAGLLVFARGLAMRGDELTATAGRLERQRGEITRREGDLDDLEAQLVDLDARLADLDRRIGDAERQHGGKIPRDEYDDYLRVVEERNEVASERNTLIAYQQRVRRDYQDEVDRHNADIEGANEQAQESTPLAILTAFWEGVTGSDEP